METGFTGTFVISWSQTEVDGLRNAPREALVVGAQWAWHGQSVCIDGPSDVLRLNHAGDAAALRRSAARRMRQFVGAALSGKADPSTIEVQDPLFDAGFVLTDGRRTYPVTLIEVDPTAPPLLMFVNDVPPQRAELWLMHVTRAVEAPPAESPSAPGIICFTPGTRIATPDGPVRVEELSAGDRVSTRDNGAQEVVWIGQRRISGARMFAFPALRPIRFGPGVLGIERPDQALLVSPDHRLLIRSAPVSALFNTPEVLVPARDLINGGSIAVDSSVREVHYIHLLLPSHQVLWANGVECDSFHPASADLTMLSDADRRGLTDVASSLTADPASYGDFARRTLSPAEAAILMHDAA